MELCGTGGSSRPRFLFHSDSDGAQKHRRGLVPLTFIMDELQRIEKKGFKNNSLLVLAHAFFLGR